MSPGTLTDSLAVEIVSGVSEDFFVDSINIRNDSLFLYQFEKIGNTLQDSIAVDLSSLVVGIGGKIPEVPIGWLRSKRSRLPGRYLENSPINLRADLTIRDNITLIRRIEELQNQPTAGQRMFSLKTSADLQVSDKLTLR